MAARTSWTMARCGTSVSLIRLPSSWELRTVRSCRFPARARSGRSAEQPKEAQAAMTIKEKTITIKEKTITINDNQGQSMTIKEETKAAMTMTRSAKGATVAAGKATQ